MAQTPKQSPPAEPKQPEFKFRTKPVQERSIFESWAVLPAKTRLRVSLAITVFAGLGILASDKLEHLFPPSPDAAKSKAASSTSS